MKTSSISKLFIGLFLGLSSLFSVSVMASPKTVPYVDVGKYVGDWYQIAHIPMVFEGGPCACTRQRLSTTDKPGVVKVYNSCNDENARGGLRSITGEAKNEDAKSNAKFSVRFEGVPVTGSYWIIGLDSAYRYAVVTDANSYSLYILSKTPTLSSELYNEAVALAATQLDTSKLEITDQKGLHLSAIVGGQNGRSKSLGSHIDVDLFDIRQDGFCIANKVEFLKDLLI